MAPRGERLEMGIRKSSEELGLQEYFKVLGMPCCLVYATLDSEKRPSQAFRTLVLQETIKRGILAPWVPALYRTLTGRAKPSSR